MNRFAISADSAIFLLVIHSGFIKIIKKGFRFVGNDKAESFFPASIAAVNPSQRDLMGCKALQLNQCFRFISENATPNGFRFVGDDRAESVFAREPRGYKSIEEGFNTYDNLKRLTKEVSECADKAELDYTSEYTYDLCYLKSTVWSYLRT